MLKKDMFDFDKNGQRGDWCFLNRDKQIAIQYGHKPIETVILPLAPCDTDQRCWEWDGNRDAPTLTPSIRVDGKYAWHGWMRNGELIAV